MAELMGLHVTTDGLEYANALLVEPRPPPESARTPRKRRPGSARQLGGDRKAPASGAGFAATPGAWSSPSAAAPGSWHRCGSAGSTRASEFAALLSPSRAPHRSTTSSVVRTGYAVDVAQHKLLYHGKRNKNGWFCGGVEALSAQEFEQRVHERVSMHGQLAERKLQAMAEQLEAKDRELEFAKTTIALLREPRDAAAEAVRKTLRKMQKALQEQKEATALVEVEKQAIENRARLVAAKVEAMAATMEEMRASMEMANRRQDQEQQQLAQAEAEQHEVAATQIQAQARGWKARAELREQQLAKRFHIAVTQIQARARGREARSNFRALVEAAQIAEQVEARVQANPVIVRFRNAVSERSRNELPILFVNTDETELDHTQSSWLQQAQGSAATLAERLLSVHAGGTGNTDASHRTTSSASMISSYL
jgi:hypothetical protein